MTYRACHTLQVQQVPRLRLVSNFGGEDSGVGKIHTREMSRSAHDERGAPKILGCASSQRVFLSGGDFHARACILPYWPKLDSTCSLQVLGLRISVSLPQTDMRLSFRLVI